MNTAMTFLYNLPPTLNLGLALAALVLSSGLLYLRRKRTLTLRRQQQGIAAIRRRQRRSAQADQALRKVLRRHLKQSLQMKVDLGKLRGQVRSLNFQSTQQSDYGQAIELVHNGKSLEPLLNQGQLNPAEAHLINLVHQKNPHC